MAEIEYSFENIKRVIPRLEECRFSENEDIRIMAMDLKRSVANCNLTERQLKIIKLLSGGFCKQQAAKLLGISKSTLSEEYKKACKKICTNINKSCYI